VIPGATSACGWARSCAARLSAGYTSQDQFARELGFDRTVIVKAETGARPPSEDIAGRIAERFPDLCNGLCVWLASIARKSNGPIPGWFADWVEVEAKATILRWWEPLLIPGLLQTEDYARAVLPWRESALRAAGNTIASAVRALVVPSGGRLTQSVAGWLARSARRQTGAEECLP
jgi:DNA-binding XRE family transcriptional regulator